jgi:hypothetical protein
VTFPRRLVWVVVIAAVILGILAGLRVYAFLSGG